MTRRVALALGLMGAALWVSAAAQTSKSQWDGIFTEQQAKRGEPLYSENCATCHGRDLSGTEMAPGLSGSEFSATWNDLRLGDLFERIRLTMPQNDPGVLSRPQNADILAYMLFKAGYPAGQQELPPETAVLNTYTFLATKPAAP